ncbi:MAG: hypothetical protein LC662_09000 [Rhodothermaceae bacterium]|nr:hypothetical protein [Rhodothermaceae bacterium]
MNWAGLLLSIVLMAGILVFRRRYINSEGQPEYGAFAVACLLFFLASLSLNYQLILDTDTYKDAAQLFMEWNRVSAVAVGMSGLIFLIRNAKPAITRFPVLFCWIPLLLIPFYAMVVNTIFLKEILLGIYEGGSIMVALLMYGLFLTRDKKYLIVVSGLLILLAGYILMWAIRLADPSLQAVDFFWAYQLVFAWGSGLMFYGIHKL